MYEILMDILWYPVPVWLVLIIAFVYWRLDRRYKWTRRFVEYLIRKRRG